MAADLKKYEASGEVRIIIYFVPVVKGGVEENKLLLMLWLAVSAHPFDRSFIHFVMPLKGPPEQLTRLWYLITRKG